MKSRKNVLWILILYIAVVSMLMPTNVRASVIYLPDVTAQMTKASYWSGKEATPDEVLVSQDEIEEINQSVLNTKGLAMNDLANWSQETYDGIKRNEQLKEAAREDAEYSYDGLGAKFKDGVKLDHDTAMKELYGPLIDNCADPEATESMPVLFGICTTRTTLRSFPTDQPLPDDPSDPDFDVLYLTAINVGEPMVARGKSADGNYYHVLSEYLSGWVPAEDIAFCRNKAEWLSAWQYDWDKTLVVYDDKIYTEESNYAPQTAKRKLAMGTCLKLADPSEYAGLINNRSAYNNHVVWMPVRLEDGSYEAQLALISEHCKVNEGYLPLTSANIAMVAMNQLGDAYGWGGMLGTNDCSGYIQNVYRCFGLKMSRNTTYQKAQPVKKIDIEGMSDEQKTEIIKELPLGAELLFSGHAMMYLGHEGDKLYVISSVSTLMVDGARTRVRGGVINTLDIKRANGNSWLSSLTTATIPYYKEGEGTDLSSASVSGIKNMIFTGSACEQDPEIKLDGTLLKENVHYTLNYSDNKDVGTATLLIKGKGNYTGTISRSFAINPKGTKIVKMAAGKKAIKIKWKKQTEKMSAKRITGYQIQIGVNKTFTGGKKTVTVKKYTTSLKKITGLAAGKKYYIRIRTFVAGGSKKYYSAWSEVKAIKTK